MRILSLGWGVQSWTLAAMAALGDIEPVDFAIHADTTWEHAHTYNHAQKWTPWLEERGVRVITVSGNRTDVVRMDWSNSIIIPAFTADTAGGKGQVRRQCTHDWKIMPIRKFIRDELKSQGISRIAGVVKSIQGISYDEWQRIRTSDVKYIENVYPLVEQKITRADCAEYLRSHNLDVPEKSSCVFCPYKSIPAWKLLKRLGGKDWDTAVAVDEAIRHKRETGEGKPGHEIRKGMSLFVHPGRKPLAKAISIPEDYGAEQMEFEMPCDSGYCFV